jgi:hypothetical protein
MIRKLAVALIAVTCLLVGTASAVTAAPDRPDFHQQALASGLSNAQTAALQSRVNQLLASIPGGRQVSATEITYDGLIVTFDPNYVESPGRAANGTVTPNLPSDITCSSGWFCIIVRGTTFSYTKCGQYWDLSNWWGNSPFKNNQSELTVAHFYDNNWKDIWDDVAYHDGYVDVTPFWHFRPC